MLTRYSRNFNMNCWKDIHVFKMAILTQFSLIPPVWLPVGKGLAGYRKFMREGVGLGTKPELTGGGLLRSHGGWSQVMAKRRAVIMRDVDTRNAKN